MKKGFKKLACTALSAGLILTCLGSTTNIKANSGEVAIQFLGINDLHGQLEGTGSVYQYGKKLPQKGGSTPLLATYLNDAEKKFKDEKKQDAVSIRIQAGDMVGASPAVSGILQDEPTIKALNKMRFEIGTLGNHEFDEGLDEFNRILKGEAPEKGKFNSAVENYDREKSNMEMVISNVVDKETGKTPFDWKPYLIKEYKDGENEVAKVGYIGVVTEEIPTLVLRTQWEKYNILDPATTINKYAKELKAQGVNAIVVLAHASATTASDNAQEVGGEVKKIIDGLDADSSVDVIFAGHNHVIANGTYKGVRVVEGAAQGKAIDNVVGIYDISKNDFKSIDAEVIPVLDNETVTKDADMVELANDANERIKDIVNAEIAKADKTIVRVEEEEKEKGFGANIESPVGDIITDGQLWAAKKAGYKADFAITNDGGIRSDLEVKDGIITWGAAQKVQPFGNVMQVISIKGKDLVAALNSQYDSGEKYFLQMSGIKYTYKEAPEGTVDKNGNPVKWVVDKAWIVKEDGSKEIIDENKEYVGVINDFLYGGGDDFPEFRGKKLLGALDPDTEIFVNYLKHLGKVKDPVLDRKVNVKDYKEDDESNKPVKPIIPINPIKPVNPIENKNPGNSEQSEVSNNQGRHKLPETGVGFDATLVLAGLAALGTVFTRKKGR